MSIVLCPDPFTLNTSVACAICGAKRRIRALNVGRLSTDGRRTFVCDQHFSDPQRLIEGWADFLANQRQKRKDGLLELGSLVIEQGVFIEHHRLPPSRSPSQHIARHLYARYADGPAVVISDDPTAYASSVLKQWQLLLAGTQRAIASTLLQARLLELSTQRSQMERVALRRLPRLLPSRGISFIYPDEAIQYASQFQTIYIVTKLNDSVVAKLTAVMSAGAVLVRYQ